MSNIETREQPGGKPTSPGPHLAKIVSHADPEYMGRLQVQIFREVGNNEASSTELRYAYYSSPFFGYTSKDFVGKEPDDYDNTQKAYGMWMIPPDVGTQVIVVALDGDPKKTYIIGCIPDTYMNFSVPGHAATQFAVEDSKATDKERVPVAEYNKVANPTTADPTIIPKPASPLEQVFDTQGLLEDDTRGITTSSSRREVPSAVFGISTPGPVDKEGKRGVTGKAESKVVGAFVSRLGGTTLVMDDGDDKFLRRTKANEGPPDYAAVEQDELDGLKDIPHNELVRIRTRTGHQILLHNSEDLIYIGNARGTAWIELSSDGKIDIFAGDSISVHTAQDLNLYADRDINIEAGRNYNVKVGAEMHTQVTADQILIVDGNQNIHIKQNVDVSYDQEYKHKVTGAVNKNFVNDYKHTVGNNFDLNIGGYNYQTSGGANETKAATIVESAGTIHMNGPQAATAASAESAELPKPLKTHSLPNEEGQGLYTTIVRRLPTHEPWPHHENLDPEKFKPDLTDRDVDGRNEETSETMNFTPDYWKQYSTKTDTFAKIKAGGEDEIDQG